MNHQHQLQGQQPAQASSKASVHPSISKPEYHAARRLVRECGRSGFAMLAPRVFVIMDILQSIQDSIDPLTERADIIAYCQRAGIDCNIRHTRFSRQCV